MNREEYWNPVLETLPREKLEQLQLKKFQEIFRWAYEHSKFYRQLYSSAGIEPGDIRTFDDIRRVPKIEKAMMRDIQGKEPYPYGDILCVPLNEVTAYRQTSGTTGQPVYGNYSMIIIKALGILLQPIWPMLWTIILSI